MNFSHVRLHMTWQGIVGWPLSYCETQTSSFPTGSHLSILSPLPSTIPPPYSFSVFTILEFILTFLGFMFGLTLAVMVTIGLDDTCTAFEVVNNLDDEAEFTP